MLPPEAPSGSGSTATAASAAAAAPPSSAAAATSTPGGENAPLASADDYRQKYEELQARHKGYEELGADPSQVREVMDWARARAQEIQAGKLKLVEEQAQQAQHQPTGDDFPTNWDEMSPREQRAYLREDARKAAALDRAALKAELEAPLRQQLQTLGTQQNIWMQATELSRETGIPFQKAMQKAMEIANADQPTLLKMAFDAEAAPGRLEKEVERRVNEALAKAEQDRENADLAMIQGRGAPRFALQEPKSRQEMREQSRLKILRTIRDEVRGRGAKSA